MTVLISYKKTFIFLLFDYIKFVKTMFVKNIFNLKNKKNSIRRERYRNRYTLFYIKCDMKAWKQLYLGLSTLPNNTSTVYTHP